jgi:hypothetical protein
VKRVGKIVGEEGRLMRGKWGADAKAGDEVKDLLLGDLDV